MPVEHIYISDLKEDQNSLSFRINFFSDSAIAPYSYKTEKTADNKIRIKIYGKLAGGTRFEKWKWKDGVINYDIEPDTVSVMLWDGHASKEVWNKNDGIVWEEN